MNEESDLEVVFENLASPQTGIQIILFSKHFILFIIYILFQVVKGRWLVNPKNLLLSIGNVAIVVFMKKKKIISVRFNGASQNHQQVNFKCKLESISSSFYCFWKCLECFFIVVVHARHLWPGKLDDNDPDSYFYEVSWDDDKDQLSPFVPYRWIRDQRFRPRIMAAKISQ